MIFILCTVVLLLIFLPKMMMQRRYAGLSKADQKKLMIMAMSVNSKSSNGKCSVCGSEDFASSAFRGPSLMQANTVQAIRRGSSQYSRSVVASEKSITSSNSTGPHDPHDEKHYKSAPMTLMESPPPVIDECNEMNADSDVESDCNNRVNGNKQLMDATSLFQQMITVISNKDGTTPTLESFLNLVDRNKLSEQERTTLDDTILSLQDTVAA